MPGDTTSPQAANSVHDNVQTPYQDLTNARLPRKLEPARIYRLHRRPLTQDYAEKVAAGTIVTSKFGSTECGHLPTEFTEEPDGSP